jgi:3-oxoacyl-ACP reductase-like protein
MDNIFTDLNRTEYVVDESGIRIPHSDFDRPSTYYDKLRDRTYTGDEYANMCSFKDKNTALFDKRWQSAKAVIDMIATEVNINPETCGLYLYALVQKQGEFESPLVEEMRKWFDKSGDKAKLKKQIKDLETQIDALRAVLRG